MSWLACKCDVGDDHDGRLGSAHRGVVLRLRKTKSGVNQSVRVSDPAVVHLLRDVVASTPRPDALLFGFRAAWYRRLLRLACRHLGLAAAYVPHSLRHGGATYMAQRGVPVATIMKHGRWASVKITNRYLQDGEALLLALSVPTYTARLGAHVVLDIISFIAAADAHSVGWTRRAHDRAGMQ